MKCDKCNQEIPEAVWVGPGDEVLFTGKQFKVVGESRRFENMIVVEGFGPYCDPFARAYPDELRTLDGRPVAVFRDPRDEHIALLERQLKAIDTEALSGMVTLALEDLARNRFSSAEATLLCAKRILDTALAS